MDFKKLTPLLIIVLAIVAFLAGSVWTNLRQAKQEESLGKAKKETVSSPTSFKPEKKEIPEVEFFVMSFCPFGNQAETGLKPVFELLGDKVSWQPVYIVAEAKKSCQLTCVNKVYDENRCQQLIDSDRVPDLESCKKYFPYDDEETCIREECVDIKEGEFSSLHGDQELNQDIREICVWNLGEPEKWWDFVEKTNKNCSSSNADSCWQDQAREASLNVVQIEKCQQEQGKSLLVEHLSLTEKYGVGGSPTIYINSTLYKGGRQPEDYKKAICIGFEKEPPECETILSSTNQAPAAGSCN